jgi:prolyl-tRNA synthetase
MPAIQPAELWQESGRWGDFGPLLLKIRDRGEREYCYGPTHEEVMTEFARAELRSYKQLPVCFYQIQTKFRDEIRPRFGIMRAREFLMKDGYSFHENHESLDQTYQSMHAVYTRIIERLGLKFRAVQADSGAIGGKVSVEFQVLAESGEDAIAYCPSSGYAANVEAAEAIPSSEGRPEAGAELATVDTPDQRTIEDVCDHLGVTARQCIKTLMITAADGQTYAVCLRGDHQLNELKLSKLEAFADGFEMADEASIKKATKAGAGFVGPVGLSIPVIVDRSAALLADFVCGANQDGKHLTGANWDRDANIELIADLRNVVAGDPSPVGEGTLEIARGIEVGHIFQLGSMYSESMNAVVLNESGRAVPMIMGCYGFGVSRIVAAAIEQNHDDRGIIWPEPIAPFTVVICPLNMHKSQRVREAAEALYQQFLDAGVEVLLEDRKVRPGVMFAEMELIGIPHRIVVAEKALDRNEVEYRARTAEDNEFLPLDGAFEAVTSRFNH